MHICETNDCRWCERHKGNTKETKAGERSFEAYVVLNDADPNEVHMIRDRLGNDGLAIYPFQARALDEDGEPFHGTRVVKCTVTYSLT